MAASDATLLRIGKHPTEAKKVQKEVSEEVRNVVVGSGDFRHALDGQAQSTPSSSMMEMGSPSRTRMLWETQISLRLG